MSMKRLNKEYCCSPSAKQYAHVLYELGISKEAVGETERLFEEVPVLEETFASPVVPMREKLSSIDKIFPEEIKNFLKVVCRNQRMSEIGITSLTRFWLLMWSRRSRSMQTARL